MRIFISSIALLFISSSFGFGEDPEELSVAPRVVRELKVVSVVRGMPVYEYEVREAVQQHAHELQGLSGEERVAEERAIYKRELRRIIERELIIEEFVSRLRSLDRHAAIDELKAVCAKEAQTRMNDIRSKMKIANDADFETFLADARNYG